MKTKPENRTELISQYNDLCDRIHAKPNANGYDTLKSLSDSELLVFMAAKTLAFGRPFDKAIENAELHLENREKALRLFSNSQPDPERMKFEVTA